MAVAGILLTLGLVLGFAGAAVPSLQRVWTVGLPEQLELISTRIGPWITSALLFAGGLAAAVLGVVVLGGRLVQLGAGVSAWIAIGAFLTGTVLWLIHLGFRMTVVVAVSRDVGSGRPMPDWFPPWQAWGYYLLACYVVLASIGLIALGVAVIATSPLPDWSGWTVIVLGAVFIVTFAIFRDTLPVLPHLGTGLLGILALLEGLRSGG